MLRMIPLLLWITLFLTSTGCSGAVGKIDVGRLLTSGRDGWQHPDRVIASLELRAGDRVAEIGAGSGYWLAHLSRAVGPTGKVYAVEVEEELVEELNQRVASEGFGNVEVILGAYHDPRLPDGEIDLAMTCLTYHHIEDRVPYFEELKKDLSGGGRVAQLDDRPDSPAPISWFQGEGHWTDPELIRSEMEEAGYVLGVEFDFLPAQSFQIFEPEHSETAAQQARTEASR